MKKLITLFCLIIITFSNSFAQRSITEFYLPAEWETQSAVITGGSDDAATFEMIQELSKDMKVYCLIAESDKENNIKKFTDAGIDLNNIKFITSPIDFDYAQRDGFMFMKNDNGEKQIVNFAWNLYGWYFEPEYKNFIDKDKEKREIYNEILFKEFPYPVISSPMVNEGGAIETNGKGTILQVESVNMQRNPDMTKESQEAELTRVLNAKKIIWLKEGPAEDPFGWGSLITENYFGVGVKGHLDEFCRFVNENTILISYPDSAEAELDPVKKITLDRMKVNYEILMNATDQDGKPFNIVKMPVPDVEYMTFALDTVRKYDEIKFLSQMILYYQKDLSIGDTVHFVPSSSYMNFLITNNTVIAPKYWTEGKPESAKLKDEKAKQILQQYFPERKIYQINTEETNHNGGGLHCWSMQVPE